MRYTPIPLMQIIKWQEACVWVSVSFSALTLTVQTTWPSKWQWMQNSTFTATSHNCVWTIWVLQESTDTDQMSLLCIFLWILLLRGNFFLHILHTKNLEKKKNERTQKVHTAGCLCVLCVYLVLFSISLVNTWDKVKIHYLTFGIKWLRGHIYEKL